MPDAPIRISLIEHGDFLSSRALGAEVRSQVEDLLEQGSRVVIDMSGVTGISNSFADELAAKLVASHGTERVFESVRFSSVSEDVALAIRVSIERRLRPRAAS